MEIKELTFEEIKYYWKKYLWAKYTTPIKKIDLERKTGYFYKAVDHFTQEQAERAIKATYIGCEIDAQIVGVESGYKTNIGYYRVRGLWVRENYRHKGIATKLIKWLEDRTKEKYIWTCPRETTLPFYLNYGFEVSGLSERTIYGQNYFAVKINDNY